MTNKSLKNIDLNFIFTVILKYKFFYLILSLSIFLLLYLYENYSQNNTNFYSLKFNISVNFDEDTYIDKLTRLKTLEDKDSLTNQLLNKISDIFNEVKTNSIQILIDEFTNKKIFTNLFKENNINLEFDDDFIEYSVKTVDIFSTEQSVYLQLKFKSLNNNITPELSEKIIENLVLSQEKKYQDYLIEKFQNDYSRLLSVFDTEERIRNNKLDFYQSYIKNFEDDKISNTVYFELLSKITDAEARLKFINFIKLNYLETFEAIQSTIKLPKYKVSEIDYNFIKKNQNNKIIPFLIFSFIISFVVLIFYELLRSIKLSQNN